MTYTIREWANGKLIGNAHDFGDAAFMARTYACEHGVRTFVVDTRAVVLFDRDGNRHFGPGF